MSVPIDPSVGHERALLLFQEELAAVRTDAELQALRTRWAGRKGSWVTAFMDLVGRAAPDEKRVIGRLANELKKTVDASIAERAVALGAARRPAGAVDVTLPGRLPLLGYRHPLSLVREEVQDIFTRLGYQVLEGPEVEDDYHNFEALNMPAEHPARDMQDTLYLATPLPRIGDPQNPQNDLDLKEKRNSANSVFSVDRGPRGLLRTHTSAMQIRHMEQHEPPVRLIAIGPVYRRDNLDLTHTPMFHQCEGLVVGPNITLADLKGTLLSMARALFGADQDVRFRPSFFPYTEPSAEVDIRCIRCQGKGCAICKRTGWLEILGSGMVHPAVFEYVGYDPEVVTGFAFGMGLERVAMLKWNVDDIRLFYENDLRFLEQFGQ
ncbi:MAG TPA: phenylalanine--tRNA ligase subunit alpha [Vicinamibacterales bacterium]|nr:phenylalanine--tRNA ligase subunit alpha [Vicinamibacterales bacterium]